MNSLIYFSLLLQSERLKLLPSYNKFVIYVGMLVSFKLTNHFLLVRSRIKRNASKLVRFDIDSDH